MCHLEKKPEHNEIGSDVPGALLEQNYASTTTTMLMAFAYVPSRRCCSHFPSLIFVRDPPTPLYPPREKVRRRSFARSSVCASLRLAHYIVSINAYYNN